MKLRFYQTISMLKQRTRFLQGFAIGLFLMSALTYATVTLSTFTSGTSISSSAMNANFAAIKTKLDGMETSFESVLTADFPLTCDPGYTPGASYMNILPMSDPGTPSDPNFDHTTFEYTISYPGIYLIAGNIMATTYLYGLTINLEVTDSSNTWIPGNFPTGSATYRKLVLGQRLRIKVGCGSKKGVSSGYIDSTHFSLLIKRL
jgi:hypothetical protein